MSQAVVERDVAQIPVAREDGKVLVLRSVGPDRKAHGGFQYPEGGGFVEAPDWNPHFKCGGGLHGLLWGEGDVRLMRLDNEAIFQVIEAELFDMVTGKGELENKCKVRRGVLQEFASRQEAAKFIYENGGAGRKVPFLTLTGGNHSTLTGGNYSTLTGGENTNLIFKYWDDNKRIYRVVTGLVGEDELKAGVAYRLDEKHKIVAVK